jgi:hypothetical protein
VKAHPIDRKLPRGRSIVRRVAPVWFQHREQRRQRI